VLDNGVTSNEFWTIIGVANDLSWIAFHYAGAATSVGQVRAVVGYASACYYHPWLARDRLMFVYTAFVVQRYLGGLLCTADGGLPDASQLDDVWPAFQYAGIEPWELFVVNNDPQFPGAIDAGPPPLDFYRKEVLASKQ
jgi:hypothetical protein